MKPTQIEMLHTISGGFVDGCDVAVLSTFDR